MTVQPEPSPSSREQVGPADPEHDPTASYALDPAYARALTGRVVSTTGRRSRRTPRSTGSRSR